MRIKLLKTCIVGKEPVRKNSVIESKDAGTIAEMKALVQIGYAVETTEELRNTRKSAETVIGEAITKDNGTGNKDTFDAAAILAGTVAEVTELLNTTEFSVEELIALRDAEKAGKDRTGVLDAIAEFDLGDGE